MVAVLHTYSVKAHWDGEAQVWWSETDIPGLVIEAESLSEFLTLLKQLGPEMLAEHGELPDAPVEFVAVGPLLTDV